VTFSDSSPAADDEQRTAGGYSGPGHEAVYTPTGAHADDEIGAEGNRLVGAVPKTVLEYIATSLADDPDGVFVDVEEGRGDVMLRLHVAPGDMGRVIGKHGRVAQAIRQVVRAAGAREGIRASVDIVD
jgi:predicted RNA-binding protein YlqC (UPF0109 family)